MPGYNDKTKIIEHYDQLSPYYRTLWGEHLHHGFWKTGTETKEEAQTALTAHLADAAQIPYGADILDVGCGFGGSGLYLAANYHATVVGMTISPVQAAIARQSAEKANANVQFVVMDADRMALRDTFDVIWSIEAISHFANKSGFFLKAAEMLRPGGTLALIDWFKQETLSIELQKSYITPIERGMLVELKTTAEYQSMLRAAGLEIRRENDLTRHCSKTWDICARLIRNRALWQLARQQGVEFVRFLRSVNAMRRGFASGCFVYGMLVAQKGKQAKAKLNDSK